MGACEYHNAPLSKERGYEYIGIHTVGLCTVNDIHGLSVSCTRIAVSMYKHVCTYGSEGLASMRCQISRHALKKRVY